MVRERRDRPRTRGPTSAVRPKRVVLRWRRIETIRTEHTEADEDGDTEVEGGDSIASVWEELSRCWRDEIADVLGQLDEHVDRLWE